MPPKRQRASLTIEQRETVNKRRRELYAQEKQDKNKDRREKYAAKTPELSRPPIKKPTTYCKAYNFSDADLPYCAGKMDKLCTGCHALHFDGEKTVGSKSTNYLECCNHGKVQLAPLNEFPSQLKCLLLPPDTDIDSSESVVARKKSNAFKENIRQYNSSLATAGLRAHLDTVCSTSRGPYCYRIHGQVFIIIY